MTEPRTVKAKTGEELPRCVGAEATKPPCWRPATERFAFKDEELTLCPEHARALHLGLEVDDWSSALDIIDEWLEGPVSKGPSGHLERLATDLQDEIRREYASASLAAYAADKVAQQGPPKEGDPPLTSEQSEELARLIVRADSLTNARTLVEDVPDEVLGLRERWLMASALASAAKEAAREAERYKEALGFPPLEARDA